MIEKSVTYYSLVPLTIILIILGGVFFEKSLARSAYAALPSTSDFDQDLDAIMREMLGDIEDQIRVIEREAEVVESQIRAAKKRLKGENLVKFLAEKSKELSGLLHAKWRLAGVRGTTGFLVYQIPEYFDVSSPVERDAWIQKKKLFLKEGVEIVNGKKVVSDMGLNALTDLDIKIENSVTTGRLLHEKLTPLEKSWIRATGIDPNIFTQSIKSEADTKRFARVLRGYIHERKDILQTFMRELRFFENNPDRYKAKLARIQKIVDLVSEIVKTHSDLPNSLITRLSQRLEIFHSIEKMRDTMRLRRDSILDGTYKKYFKIFQARSSRGGFVTLPRSGNCACSDAEKKIPQQKEEIEEVVKKLEREARLKAPKTTPLKPSTVSKVVDILGRSALISVTVIGESAQFVFIWLDESISTSVKMVKTANGLIDSLVLGAAGWACPLATGSSLAITGVTEYFFPDLLPKIPDEVYSFIFDQCSIFLEAVKKYEKNLKDVTKRIEILEQALEDFKKNPHHFQPPYNTEKYFKKEIEQLKNDKNRYTLGLERSQSTYVDICLIPKQKQREKDYGF